MIIPTRRASASEKLTFVDAYLLRMSDGRQEIKAEGDAVTKSQSMKSCRIQVVFLILAGLISMPAHAEVMAGRWEKVAVLEMASPITVELQKGDRINGQFRGLSPSAMAVLSPAG